jgi:hypothetical protein
MSDEPAPMKQQMEQEPRSIDDLREWMGAEGTVGAQAGRHLRRRGVNGQNLIGIILGLTFVGGLTLGGALGCLWRHRLSQKDDH